MIRNVTFGLCLLAIGAAAIVGCKPQMVEPISAVRDVTMVVGITKEEAIEQFEEYHKGYRCAGCHELADSISDWATKTNNVFVELDGSEIDTNTGGLAESFGNVLENNRSLIGGIYKARPEYFARHFHDENTFREWKSSFQDEFAIPGGMDMSKVRSRRTADGQRINLTPEQRNADFAKMVTILRQYAANIGQQGSGETACVNGISAAHRSHIENMKTAGLQNKIGINRFYGCDRGNDPAKCFKSGNFKDISLGAAAGNWKVVEVEQVGTTSYWTRSSMDGRFVGNGGPARLDDLANKVSWHIAGSLYDPGFFPTGRGFTFHGGSAVFCDMQAIAGPSDPDEYASWRDGLQSANIGGDPDWKIADLDPETSDLCVAGAASGGVTTYQSVGGGLDVNAKGFVITGSHNNDPGNSGSVGVTFSGDLKVYEIDYAQGGGYKTPQEIANFNLPGEGDYSLSPTSQFISGRFGIDGEQAGYRMRSLGNMLETGAENYSTANDPTVSTICMEGLGSKPLFSIDERFIAFHQYETSGDDVSANVYVVDLLADDPQPVKVTKFTGNNKALFAHFRADGWLYWLFDDGTENKKIHATNIAVLMAD